MGIEVWSLRVPRQTAFYGYTLYRHQKPVGWLLADADLRDTEENTLVEAIVKAMQMPYTGGLCTHVQAMELLNSPVRIGIILGEKAWQQWGPSGGTVATQRGQVHTDHHRSMIVSYAPSQLLADKKLKAAVWQDVQMALRQMSF